MRSLNKVILIGNVTKDPEIKETANGQKIAMFGVATNRDWTTANGERKTSTEFHNVVVWGKLAEICSQFIKKGKLVYIEGYLKTRSWDNESGVRTFKTEVVVEDIISLQPEKRIGKDGEMEEAAVIPEAEEQVLAKDTPTADAHFEDLL